LSSFLLGSSTSKRAIRRALKQTGKRLLQLWRGHRVCCFGILL